MSLYIDSMEAFLERIAAGTDETLEHIFLSGKACAADIHTLAAWNLPKLTSVDLSDNKLTTGELAPFFEKKRRKIEGMILAKNKLDSGVMNGIFAMESVKLIALNLAENQLDNDAVGTLVKKAFGTLTTLVLDNNNISVIPECDLSRLEYLDVRENPIDEDSMRRLVRWAVGRNAVLKMDGHIIDYDYLRECIESQTESLKHLNISGRDVDNGQVEALKSEFSDLKIFSEEKKTTLH